MDFCASETGTWHFYGWIVVHYEAFFGGQELHSALTDVIMVYKEAAVVTNLFFTWQVGSTVCPIPSSDIMFGRTMEWRGAFIHLYMRACLCV